MAASAPAARSPALGLLLLALLALAGCSLVAGAARLGAGAQAASRGGGGGQRSAAPARSLLQQACTCPATDAAKSTCAQVSQNDQDTLLRTAVQFCTRLGWTPGTCCPALPVNDSKWQQWTACLCAGDNPSLTAFVDGPRIVQTCGCGGYTSSQSSPVTGGSSAAIVSSIASASASASGSGSSSSSASANANANANANAGGSGGSPGQSPDAQQVVAALTQSYAANGQQPPFGGGATSGQQQQGASGSGAGNSSGGQG